MHAFSTTQWDRTPSVLPLLAHPSFKQSRMLHPCQPVRRLPFPTRHASIFIRREKNRLAAQRSRARKMAQLNHLSDKLDKLEGR